MGNWRIVPQMTGKDKSKPVLGKTVSFRPVLDAAKTVVGFVPLDKSFRRVYVSHVSDGSDVTTEDADKVYILKFDGRHLTIQHPGRFEHPKLKDSEGKILKRHRQGVMMAFEDSSLEMEFVPGEAEKVFKASMEDRLKFLGELRPLVLKLLRLGFK